MRRRAVADAQRRRDVVVGGPAPEQRECLALAWSQSRLDLAPALVQLSPAGGAEEAPAPQPVPGRAVGADGARRGQPPPPLAARHAKAKLERDREAGVLRAVVRTIE